jgi:phospholipase C
MTDDPEGTNKRGRAGGQLTRRDLLKAGAAVGAGSAIVGTLGAQASAGAAGSIRPGRLNDIEHVVILMQENRPFDHYFGSLSGIRGFSDPTAIPGVFSQLDPDVLQNPSHLPYILPWRFDTTTTDAQAAPSQDHEWYAQHYQWNNGLMNLFVVTQRLATGQYGPNVMSYFLREDIPYYYALADAFTICDNYHCSVLADTIPNRLVHTSGTIDPDGTLGGGPVISDISTAGALKWENYAQRLEAAGIDWYCYQEADDDGNNVLYLFDAFQDPTSDLYRRGCSVIPTPAGQPYGPALLAKFASDVASGNLPQVSWIYAAYVNCEHPSATPAYGQDFTNQLLQILMNNPKVWAKTAFILNYDENDGKFDHVPPPTPPPGTAGEYISLAGDLENLGSSFGIDGPIGLGFRVPCIVMSPWTTGGLACHTVLDHTSVLRFLERRFGVEVPYLSDWRRTTVGDLTEAFNFGAGANAAIPALPDTSELVEQYDTVQANLPAPTMPAQQSMPVQESGPPRPQPSGIV